MNTWQIAIGNLGEFQAWNPVSVTHADERECTKCHTVKPVSEFWDSADRINYECKTCQKDRVKLWKRRNYYAG